MKSNLLLLLAVSISMFSFAQTEQRPKRCADVEHELFLQQQDPNRKAQREAYEAELQKWIDNNPDYQQKTQAVITIPVVVHVVYKTAAQNISDQQVISQIQVLNEDFTYTNPDASQTPTLFKPKAASANINWCMAKVDPQGNPTNGIVRKSTTHGAFSDDDAVKKSSQGGDDAWPTTKYFNIWVCDLGTQLLGYGEFPTSSATTTFGFVANCTCYGVGGTAQSPYDKGRTATHEIGHCLNLFHIWGDEAACAADDGVTDTPKQKAENYGAPTFPQGTSASGGCCTASDQSSMYMNYMDYTDDAAMNMFTAGQVTKMTATLNAAPYNALKTSTACASTGIEYMHAQDIFQVYPNPTTGTIAVAFSYFVNKNAVVNVKNMLGETVQSVNLNGLTDKTNLDLSNNANGVYFVELINNGTSKTQKIVLDKK